MNNLLKDFKIQPTKLRGENMEKEIQILTRYEDPTIKQLQQELTNLKAIEKEHQRMNGELREENKELKHIIDELEKWLKYEIYCDFDEKHTMAYQDSLNKLRELKGDKYE